jgi:hypothetical protein
MAHFSLRRPRDKLLYTVAKDMHLHADSSSLHAPSREAGFVAAHENNAPRGTVERAEGVLIWLCTATLVAAFAYFVFRCYEFIRN